MRKVPMPVAGTATDEPSKLTGQSSPEKRGCVNDVCSK